MKRAARMRTVWQGTQRHLIMVRHMGARDELRFEVEGAGEVPALIVRPAKAQRMLVLAHGAGAGMKHPFMEALAEALASEGVATFRYQFPYMEHGRRVPDAPKVLTATVAAAVRAASTATHDLPLFAGGKSMGGRMSSQAAAEKPLEKVNGLIFFGFPLHPPNRPGTKRADHLKKVTVPMLFLQGSRDSLADLDLLRPICKKIGPQATLHEIADADHSFHVRKRSGRHDGDVLSELAATAALWAQNVDTKY